MNPIWALAVVGGIGLVLGLVLGSVTSGYRRNPRHSPVEPPAGELSEAVADVLNVLRSASVVLDADGSLIKSSSAAHAFGLVRGRELVHGELRAMALEAATLDLVRERELELARGPFGRGRLVVFARVAPLGGGLILILVEDRTEARRVEEIRRDFVANVSHELKTPIGALSLLAEAVSDAADDPDAVRHFANRMQRESMRLSKLVQEIIDLSRLQVADALHPPEPVGIDEVVSDAVDRCRLAAGAKGIDVVIGGDTGAVVYGDHSLLVTAIRNLVDNAISYSEENTRVGVGVRRCEGVVEVVVSDQGIGIAAAEQDRIFERFYRIDPARSRATGGTGLGLSIVKHVAANHGGEATVWSLPGQGSTFTLRLPETVPSTPRPVTGLETGLVTGSGLTELAGMAGVVGPGELAGITEPAAEQARPTELAPAQQRSAAHDDAGRSQGAKPELRGATP